MGPRSRNVKPMSPQLACNNNYEMNILLNNSNKSSVGSRTPNFSDSKCQLIITSPQQRPFKMHPQQIFTNPNLDCQGGFRRRSPSVCLPDRSRSPVYDSSNPYDTSNPTSTVTSPIIPRAPSERLGGPPMGVVSVATPYSIPNAKSGGSGGYQPISAHQTAYYTPAPLAASVDHYPNIQYTYGQSPNTYQVKSQQNYAPSVAVATGGGGPGSPAGYMNSQPKIQTVRDPNRSGGNETYEVSV